LSARDTDAAVRMSRGPEQPGGAEQRTARALERWGWLSRRVGEAASCGDGKLLGEVLAERDSVLRELGRLVAEVNARGVSVQLAARARRAASEGRAGERAAALALRRKMAEIARRAVQARRRVYGCRQYAGGSAGKTGRRRG